MPRGDKIKDYQGPAAMADQAVLLQFFKALGDETRLQIIGLLSEDTYRVSDLAAELGLTEPTVSHHIGKLREVGLLNLRTEGTNRWYTLNTEMFGRMTRFVELVTSGEWAAQRERYEAAKRDMAWIDDIDLDLTDAERKVFQDYFLGRTLKQIPTKYTKLLVILRWLVTLFEPGRMYSEVEVNAVLKPIHEDYARLRRELVEQGFLAREGGGGQYWRVEE